MLHSPVGLRISIVGFSGERKQEKTWRRVANDVVCSSSRSFVNFKRAKTFLPPPEKNCSYH